MKPFYYILLACCIFNSKTASCQLTLRGVVYDSSKIYGVSNVLVCSTGGATAITDTTGAYSIAVNEKDSIWFYYNDKPTIKFPLHVMTDINNFDISLNVKVSAKFKRMKEVVVYSKSYRQDSLENREKYRSVFGYEKPGLKTSMSNGVAGADLDEIIRFFSFRKNKDMKKFQTRLILEEQEKYIDYKFTKKVVQQLTGLTGNERDTFMLIFRPTYEFTVSTTLYDFYWYIKMSGQQYKMGTRQNLFFKRMEAYMSDNP